MCVKLLGGVIKDSKIQRFTRLRFNLQQLRERQGDRERDGDSPASEAAELLNWGRFLAKQARLLSPLSRYVFKKKEKAADERLQT